MFKHKVLNSIVRQTHLAPEFHNPICQQNNDEDKSVRWHENSSVPMCDLHRAGQNN